MKKALFLLFAFLFFVVPTSAQTVTTEAVANSSPVPTPTVEEKKDKKDTAKNDDGAAKENKFNLPPEKLNPVKIPRFEVSPTIDGKLDEPFWQTAAQFKDFFQTGPGDNIAPSKPTIAYMGYDAEHLYVAFYCWDEPDKIRATVAKRDNVFGEDNVRFWLDTYNDQRRAYVFGFNPLGIQQDGIFTEGQGADFSVDVVMESKGAIHADGWAVEIKIPFKSIRYSIGKGKMWGFNAARNIDRFNDEFDQWLPDDRDISGFLIKHGKITGIEDIKVERTLEIVPSVTLSETGTRKRNFAITSGVFDPGRFVNEGIKNEIGVNVKFNFTPNITLDAAFNPDFAEIEADAPVVTSNQRFPIFFQEKRPFFLEGADIFQTPLQAFYSRTIIDPDIAAKLTGKVGKTSFGFLVASDKAPGNYSEEERADPIISQRISEFVDKNASFAVVRVKRDFGSNNEIGFFGTMRSFPEQKNLLGGFDGRFKLSPRLDSRFQILGTHSRRCFEDEELEPLVNPAQAQRNREVCGSTFNNYRTGNGFGYTVNLDYTEENRGFFLEAFGRSRDYRADAGFTRRTNYNRLFAAGRLSTESKPKAAIIRFDFRPFTEFGYNFEGKSQDINVGSSFNLSLQKNTFVFFETGVYFERLFEQEFGLKRTPTRGGAFFGDSERSVWQHYVSGNISKTFNKKLNAGIFVGHVYNAYDFDFGGGDRFPRVSPAAQRFGQNAPLDPGPGRQFDMGVNVNYKPIDPLNISFSYNKARLTRKDTGLTAFDSNIFSLRSTYQFTRFTFLRTRLDYNSISSNASGQILLGYNPNPGTAFYVGYNDNFNYNGFNPYTGDLEPRFERNSRTFFIRASYLFRKSF